MDIKIVINDVKIGKSYQKAVDGGVFFGRKIGEKVSGETMGFSGYEFEITGGSDNTGFPMRKDVGGAGRKSVLVVSGVGVHKKRVKGGRPKDRVSGNKGRGIRVKRSVAGNTIGDSTSQINLKIMKYGGKAISDFFADKKTGEESGGEETGGK